MKKRVFALSALCLMIVTGVSFGAVITSLHNTGDGVAAGAIDPNYRITLAPAGGPDAFTLASKSAFPFPYWLADSGTSQWISPNNSGATVLDGNYTYRTTFSVFGNLTTGAISGKWATDNEGAEIFLNGTSTGITLLGPFNSSNFNSFHNFTIASGFVTGTNTLDFVVINDVQATGNPSGLRVELASVPEPGTMMLLGSGLVGLAGLGRKKFRNS